LLKLYIVLPSTNNSTITDDDNGNNNNDDNRDDSSSSKNSGNGSSSISRYADKINLYTSYQYIHIKATYLNTEVAKEIK
jgi:hypothetical protein